MTKLLFEIMETPLGLRVFKKSGVKSYDMWELLFKQKGEGYFWLAQ